MWTNEIEWDITTITVMDDEAGEEDVVIEMSDKHVDIRQFNNTLQKYDLITLTPKMMLELIEAFQHPEGMFMSELRRPQQ